MEVRGEPTKSIQPFHRPGRVVNSLSVQQNQLFLDPDRDFLNLPYDLWQGGHQMRTGRCNTHTTCYTVTFPSVGPFSANPTSKIQSACIKKME